MDEEGEFVREIRGAPRPRIKTDIFLVNSLHSANSLAPERLWLQSALLS
jgi:hypothetical protein